MPKTNAAGSVLLETRHLTRQIAGITLVADITLQLHAGEIFALVGHSGAGKTSLLRLLNRLDEPTSGTVLLVGQDYRTLPPRDLRRHVALVMQQPLLFRGTVADNLRFGPRQRGIVLPDAALDSLLKQVGLAGYAPRSAAHLSGGAVTGVGQPAMGVAA